MGGGGGGVPVRSTSGNVSLTGESREFEHGLFPVASPRAPLVCDQAFVFSRAKWAIAFNIRTPPPPVEDRSFQVFHSYPQRNPLKTPKMPYTPTKWRIPLYFCLTPKEIHGFLPLPPKNSTVPQQVGNKNFMQ